EAYKPEYARLLRLRYVEGKQPSEVAAELGIAERTFRSWKEKAEKEFVRLAG
ncbi:sigma factor-like helix-turn-helix DNA-binding protein, partial [Paenibacillus naphthalenovorans]|uniref:sigma factor-like helix-turn-helix DNA-binding protein n=1 Tax=Paenibacillus naphthalenovorans TaxID=162209 RepID=UPI003D2A16ED